MADHTHIEWTDATWNPVTGCSVVSPGCTNCYAMKLAGTRLKHHWSRVGLTTDTRVGPVWNGKVRFNEGWLDQPLRWKQPRMIFVCAHGDLFHPDVPDSWIDQVFAVMALCPQHTFQVLTKRPERMREYLTTQDHVADDGDGIVAGTVSRIFFRAATRASVAIRWPLPNVWLGTSVEDQRRADERIPHLLATPAAVRFLSAEPLLGPVDLTRIHEEFDGGLGHSWESCLNGKRFDPWSDGDIDGMPALDWVIVGGESGGGARPMHPDWARTLRDKCAAAGVPFFFKQWGSWAHRPDLAHFKPMLTCEWQRLSSQVEGVRPALMVKEGKKAAGRLLDGVEHNGMPGPDRHD